MLAIASLGFSRAVRPPRLDRRADTSAMSTTENRRSKVTPEHQAEAAALKRLWDAYKRQPDSLTQKEFGQRFEIGKQAAVGNFVNGKIPLSLKAAAGFAKGLGVAIEKFSPRLAGKAAALTPASQPQDWRAAAELVAKRVPDPARREQLLNFITFVDRYLEEGERIAASIPDIAKR